MTLTPEQFNKLVTKTEFQELKDELKEEIKEVRENTRKTLDVLDFLVKKYEDHDSEHVANIDAHDRMQIEIDECRKKLSLKTAPAFSR